MDCDETFNYWEPTHYLQHGTGLQTWEYSPIYAIRSWAYISLHTLVSGLGGWMFQWTSSPKLASFYFVRFCLGILSSWTEAKFYVDVARWVNKRVARYLLIMLASSAGMFIASTAYLPSSFAMYFVTLAFSISLQPPSRHKTQLTILCFTIATILGWPFAGALAIPFVIEEIFLSGSGIAALRQWSLARKPLANIFTAGVQALVIVALPMFLFDSHFYQKTVFVPLNIVWYNVFSHGPDLYGTEPWSFYVQNLTINFNILFALAAISPLLVTASKALMADRTANFFTPRRRERVSRTFLVFHKMSAFNMWFLIFSKQPHKEERFMFVVYPLLCFNAAVGMYCLRAWLTVLTRRKFRNVAPSDLTGVLLVVSAILSLNRILALQHFYSSPMSIYARLGRELQPGETVCVGKEWHRFPTHYFLPGNQTVSFVKSSFGGLLPKPFSPDEPGRGWRQATWRIPSGMNDENKEELDRYVTPQSCDWLIDLSLTPSSLDPDYANLQDWKRVHCEPFLDKDHTHRLMRVLWIPVQGKRSWADYCLLKRKQT